MIRYDPRKVEFSASDRDVKRLWEWLFGEEGFKPPEQDPDDKLVEEAINQFNKETDDA